MEPIYEVLRSQLDEKVAAGEIVLHEVNNLSYYLTASGGSVIITDDFPKIQAPEGPTINPNGVDGQ